MLNYFYKNPLDRFLAEAEKMARIPETEIERLKSEVSVERLVEASGIALKKAGKDLTGCCPFHEDDTASLVVTPAKNLWHCFGCGAAGGPIDWVIKKNGVSFRHAVELLRDGISTLAASPVKRTTVRKLEAPVALDADEQLLLNQVIDYYHDTLKTSPEALAYLQTRGIASTEAVEHFKLGFANRTLGLRLPEKNRVAGSSIRTRLQKIGIYRESGHEHFNGSLIVPVLNEQGNVVEVYGRKLLDNLRAGTPKHLYLPAREGGRGVFNVAALQASKEIILCEALIDALTFWCAGYRNVTSAYGIEGFTEDHLAAFKQYGTQRVLIAYDRDEAGERGAAKVSALLMQAGIEAWRIQFPKGMDANEYALKVTPASKSLGVVIRKAVWLGQGKPPTPPVSEPHMPEVEAAHTFAAKECAPAESFAAKVSTEDEAPTLPASPVPAVAANDVPMVVKDKEITLTLGDGIGARRYRVRGLQKNLAVDLLKINLLVTHGELFYVDTLDLYSMKQRQSYITHAAIELQLEDGILKTDLGRVLLALEQVQDDNITQTLQPEPQPQMDEAAQQAALALLKTPDLTARILADFAACGLVGEETNKLVGYLAAVSRKLDKPLGVVIQSSSAAGKSSLMDAVLAFVPEEDKVKYSAMTGQSLFYMGETNLKHKALAIVEEEGASRASYALKLLQSEGELTIASTGKDPNTGNLITQQYRVEGPVALLVTTTARDIDEELMNRCLVLSVDEGREQTRAIHQLQRDRRTLEGLIARRDKEALIALHQNAQRLLKPLAILNPYAQFLTFPDQTTRLRRDHEKYLTLIDTIAFIHQHQRDIKSAQRGAQHIEYIEVTLADIELANRIAHDVLGRSLDELPPQTRRLLKLIDGYAVSECERLKVKRTDFHFSRRALREAIHWGDTQLKIHLARLAELEYLVTHRTKCNGFEYELVYDMAGADNSLRFPGLADIEALACAYDGARSGVNDARSGSGRGGVGPRSVGGRGNELPAEPSNISVTDDMPDTDSEPHVLRQTAKIASYSQPLPLAAAAR
jgi:DNA primase